MNEHDYEIVDWCTDTISGAKDNRPELNKILYQSDVLPRHEAVIVFKNDRVARDTKLYFYYFYTLIHSKSETSNYYLQRSIFLRAMILQIFTALC